MMHRCVLRITLHQLQVFNVVARFKSVTAAAHYLHMTQPAVSNIIKQLHDYYGCPLVETIGRQLFLTSYGKSLLNSTKSIEALVEQAKNDIAELKGGLVGSISIATVTTAKYFVPDLLGRFKKQFKNVQIKLSICNRQTIIERLEHCEDDFVIMSHPPENYPIEIQDFFSDQLVIISSPSFANNHQVNLLQDLIDAPWIMRERGSGTRHAIEQIFQQQQFIPSIEMEIGDVEAIKQLVIASMGISIVSKQSIQTELKNGSIMILPINIFPVTHKWFFVKNKAKLLSPIASKFLEFVQCHK